MAERIPIPKPGSLEANPHFVLDALDTDIDFYWRYAGMSKPVDLHDTPQFSLGQYADQIFANPN